MKLYTKRQYEQLLNNGKEQKGTKDFAPVVKWFTPDAQGTWLISEIDPKDTDMAFGLCDLGFGKPEMGSVYIPEIAELRGKMGLAVERDLQFEGIAPLSIYAMAAREHGHIITVSGIINNYINP